jgi:hypothetical protein
MIGTIREQLDQLLKLLLPEEEIVIDDAYYAGSMELRNQQGMAQLEDYIKRARRKFQQWKEEFEATPQAMATQSTVTTQAPPVTQPPVTTRPAWNSTPTIKPRSSSNPTSAWNQIPTQNEYNQGIRHDPVERNGFHAHQEQPLTFRQRRQERGKRAFRGGSLKDVSIAPGDIGPLITKQIAWEKVNSAYNDLEPKYQQLLPKPDPAPLYDLLEPFHRYIDEFADPELLEEADQYSNLIRPEEINEMFEDNTPTINRLVPFYRKALPNVKTVWLPSMVRAHLIRTLI